MAGLQYKMKNVFEKSIWHGIFLLFTLCPLLFARFSPSYAAQELLKTSRIKVGEKALLTETLKKANEEGKAIVLVLLSNPMQCNKCDTLLDIIEKESSKYQMDIVFIAAGGQDMLGAGSEETITLKKSYGFVTIGEPWIFFIDKEGILRKIYIGIFSKEELKEEVDSIIWRKE